MIFRPIVTEVLPEQERNAARVIGSNLSMLDFQVDAFFAALSLFDHCMTLSAPPDHPARAWMHVAARDGAMSIYHAQIALDGVRVCLRQCPTFDQHVDKTALRLAGRALSEHFGGLDKLRDSIAHISEQHHSPERHAKNALFGEHASGTFFRQSPQTNGTTITAALKGRTFINSWRGQLYSYDLSSKSYGHLVEARTQTYRAIAPAADYTVTLFCQSRAKP